MVVSHVGTYMMFSANVVCSKEPKIWQQIIDRHKNLSQKCNFKAGTLKSKENTSDFWKLNVSKFQNMPVTCKFKLIWTFKLVWVGILNRLNNLPYLHIYVLSVRTLFQVSRSLCFFPIFSKILCCEILCFRAKNPMFFETNSYKVKSYVLKILRCQTSYIFKSEISKSDVFKSDV